jgi:hypothetical protein
MGAESALLRCRIIVSAEAVQRTASVGGRSNHDSSSATLPVGKLDAAWQRDSGCETLHSENSLVGVEA